jgi:hypothetical protein
VRRRDTGDAGFRSLADFILWAREIIDNRLTKW